MTAPQPASPAPASQTTARALLLGERLDSTYAERQRTLRKDAAIGPVSEYSTWSAYWNGNYRKGSLLLHALRGKLGVESFWRFVREYYEAHAFGIATTASLIAAAESVHGSPLSDWFASWLGEGAP